jgi:dihydroorotase
MKVLLSKVLIADETSPCNQSVQDIFIENGVITSIADTIAEKADEIITGEHLIVTQGWVDIFAHFNEPGFEFKETIESGSEAALAGGFTDVFVLPNTYPAASTRAQIQFIKTKNSNKAINVLPIGAITKNMEGKDLAEMYDMHNSGATAFSDGLLPVQNSGLLLKALQYVKAFNGTIIQMPVDKTIGTHGLMNEGIISTQLGLAGIPSIAEEIIIKRDIDLLRYTQSKLHITGVSTAKGIALIDEARKEGLSITCSVTPYHLFFCDEDLKEYDTNLKVNPPLRTKEDMLGLRKAVMNGKVDSIASHHFPQNIDNKVCEFEAAKNGMISLQTAFAVVNEVLPDLTVQQIANLFSNNARKIFGLPTTGIHVKAKATVTVFSKNNTTVLTKANNKSLAANSPFFNQPLKGKVIAVINNGLLKKV